MLSVKKVADRVSDNSSDNNYLDRMGLTHLRIWIRHRARAIKGIKVNHKRIKDKNKNMFKLFNKSGATYKAAVFTIMKRFIKKE